MEGSKFAVFGVLKKTGLRTFLQGMRKCNDNSGLKRVCRKCLTCEDEEYIMVLSV